MSKKSLPRSEVTTKSAKAGLPFHPLADMFPLLEGKDYADLVEDIRKHGLRQDIDVSGGKIIDGRNRARACVEADVEPRYHERRFRDDASLAAFIISANIHRRHLTVADRDRLLVALLKKNPTISTLQASKAVRVSHTHAGKVRNAAQKKGDVATVATSIDTRGRKQPVKKPKTKRTRDAMHVLPVIRNDQLGERDAARIETTSLGNETEKKELVLLKRASPEQAEDLIKRAEAGELVSAVTAVAALRYGPPSSDPDSAAASADPLWNHLNIPADLDRRLQPTKIAIAAAAAQTTTIGPILPDSVADLAKLDEEKLNTPPAPIPLQDAIEALIYWSNHCVFENKLPEDAVFRSVDLQDVALRLRKLDKFLAKRRKAFAAKAKAKAKTKAKAAA